MSKGLSLLFAVLSVLLMAATAISINYSGWLVLLFAALMLGTTGYGFVLKAKLERKKAGDSGTKP